MGIPALMFIASLLSFLGAGVQPPKPSLGGMLSGDGRDFLERHPWLPIVPVVRGARWKMRSVIRVIREYDGGDHYSHSRRPGC